MLLSTVKPPVVNLISDFTLTTVGPSILPVMGLPKNGGIFKMVVLGVT